MFENLEALDNMRHGDLKYKPVKGYEFASKIPFCILGGSEVVKASKFFPIVFPEKDSKNLQLPLALFSSKLDENPCVGKDGKWSAGYIPAHIRRFPFIFAPIPEQENQFAILIDKDAPQFASAEGDPLFDKDNKPGSVIKQAQEFLTRIEMDFTMTLKLIELLDKEEVLQPKQLKINQNGKSKLLQGFRVVDTKRLSALEDSVIAQWFRNGLMGIIFAHLHSLENIQNIVSIQDIGDK
ncbi:MAG: SapC family protein [Desulfobacula sp.]|jgi:putative transposase|nr:SapC family protein [Desulfobacula sp.]